MLDAAPLPRCLYCDVQTVPRPPQFKGCIEPENYYTRDHLFPQWLLARWHGPLSPEWRYRNRVDCCWACNLRKGSMHPLEWISHLDADGAGRLHERLMLLRSLGAFPPPLPKSQWIMHQPGDLRPMLRAQLLDMHRAYTADEGARRVVHPAPIAIYQQDGNSRARDADGRAAIG